MVDCHLADKTSERDRAAFGWTYLLSDSLPDAVLTWNVRWLAGYRHPRHHRMDSLRDDVGHEKVVFLSALLARPDFELVDGGPLPRLDRLGVIDALPDDVKQAALAWEKHIIEVETGHRPDPPIPARALNTIRPQQRSSSVKPPKRRSSPLAARPRAIKASNASDCATPRKD